MSKRYGKAAECETFVKKTMPYSRAAYEAAETWADEAGHDFWGPDGDAMVESLAEAFHRFAALRQSKAGE